MKNTTKSMQRAFEIRPIKTKSDYEAALARIEALWESEVDTPDGDQLEILLTLVDAYEETKYPIELPDAIEAVKERLVEEGLVREDLVPYIGSRARISEVLNRKRPLTLPMIRRLHEGLGIPAEVLIQPPKR